MATLIELQARLEEVKQAFHSGMLTCAYEGKTVTWRSSSEMQAAIASLEAEIAALTGTSPVRSVLVRSRKGW